MIIYKDPVSGDELLSDSYPCKLIDDVLWEFTSGKMVKGTGISASLIGGNASVEEASEEMDDADQIVNNILDAHGLMEFSVTKKEFQAYLKAVIGKKLLERAQSTRKDFDEAQWKKNVSKASKMLLDHLKADNLQFYRGDKSAETGLELVNTTLVFCYYLEDDQVNPRFAVFMDAVDQEKQ